MTKVEKSNKSITDQLRKCSLVSGKQRTWISELTDAKLYNLYLHLRSGEGSRSIAPHVMTWKLGLTSIHSIAQGISKFKKRIAHLLVLPNHHEDSVENMSLPPTADGETPLDRMERLAMQLENRIKQMMEEERATGIKYPYINKDVQALASLRKAIVKQRDWEMRHGDPMTGKQYEVVKKRIEKRFDGFMNSFNENSHLRLIAMTDRFLELAEKEALIMRKKDDGTISLEKPGINEDAQDP